MSRPRAENPTPAEFEVLEVIWEKGPSTVREVMEVLNGRRPRAYTSVMSLMKVMAEKGLLGTTPKGRAFVYTAQVDRKKTRGRMLKDLLNRAFEGSASALVNQLLEEEADEEELDEIRRAIAEYKKRKGRR